MERRFSRGPVLNISDIRRWRFSRGLPSGSETVEDALSARESLSPAGEPALKPVVNTSDIRRPRGLGAPESEALDSFLSALSPAGEPVLNPNNSDSRRWRGLAAPVSEALDSFLSGLSPGGEPALNPNISDIRRWRGLDAPESAASPVGVLN